MMLQTYVGYHPTTSSFARKGAVLRGKEGFHVCGLPMRGRAEDLVGAHASSRGHSVTKSGPAQSMRLTLLHVHVALRHVAIPHVNIPRPCCAPFLWLLCFFTSSCAVDAFQLPPAVRAPSLGHVHQVEQFGPVHRAGTSARISSCVMCSTANVQDWAYWEEELALWSTKDLLQSERADEYVAMLQTRPGWQRIAAAAERCYQLGATQVLLCGPAVRDPDHIEPYYGESRIDLAVSGLNERERWRVQRNVEALVGIEAGVIPFHLDEQRQRQYEQDSKWALQAAKAASRRRAQEDREGAIALGLDFLAGLEEVTFFDDDDSDNGIYESMPLDQDIFSGSLWISRCGVVRPARSFANLSFEIGVCEEARAAGHD
jgi:hypothetical protein